MRIIHLSYVRAADADMPERWLKKIPFFTGVAAAMSAHHEIHSIHCIGYSGVISQESVTYHFFRLNSIQRIFPSKVHRYVQALRPDAVIVHGLHFPWQVLLLRRSLPANVGIFIQHHAEKPYRDFRAILQQRVDRFVSKYFFTSIQLAEQFIRHRVISSPDKVVEVMEVSSAFSPTDKLAAKRLGKINYDSVYLWVGRLDDNKDPRTLLNAFIPFAKSRREICLYMIFKNEGDRVHVEDFIRDIPENIKLIGGVQHDKMENWYNASDFVVSTSHYEGSGISVCEGMSCGCIPILTDIASFRMMTANGKIGFIFPPGDHNALADVLEESLNIDVRSERARVLQQFSENLSFEAIAHKIINTIEEM